MVSNTPSATAPVNRFRIIPLHFLLTVLASFPVFYLGKFISWLIMKPLFWLTSLPQRKTAISRRQLIRYKYMRKSPLR